VNRVDEIGARAWEIGTHGEVCFSLGAELHDERGRVLTQLPWGARFISEEDGTARLPEGTTGYVAGDMVRATERAARFPTDGVAMVRTAAEWIGTPYIWSGITPAGADCSGFAQAVWRMHGVLLPRDSDLQALAGIAVEPGPDFSNLVAGDLLFFEEIPGRITHVTISLGGARIIHSSLGNGGVRCNDLAGDTGFERNLRSIFVCARRVNPLGTA
jgi:cell wall-associated NlpC family hydrolase